jgi:hypothetical protein
MKNFKVLIILYNKQFNVWWCNFLHSTHNSNTENSQHSQCHTTVNTKKHHKQQYKKTNSNSMWDTVGLFVMTIAVSTYTIFIKVRKSYRVLVMLVCFDDVTPFGIVTDEITPWVSDRQTYSFHSTSDNYSFWWIAMTLPWCVRPVSLSCCARSGGLLDVSSWDNVLCCEAV